MRIKDMRRFLAISIPLGLAACQAPDIDDWPPEPTPLSEKEIQSYVDRYTGEYGPPPSYGPDDIEALRILMNRRAADEGASDLERFRSDLETIRRAGGDDDVTASGGRSRGEINAIKRRVERKYDTRHDRRHELKSKYGL